MPKNGFYFALIFVKPILLLPEIMYVYNFKNGTSKFIMKINVFTPSFQFPPL